MKKPELEKEGRRIYFDLTELNVKNRTIFSRDNLEVMRGMEDECIDLICLDNRRFLPSTRIRTASADYAESLATEVICELLVQH